MRIAAAVEALVMSEDNLGDVRKKGDVLNEVEPDLVPESKSDDEFHLLHRLDRVGPHPGKLYDWIRYNTLSDDLPCHFADKGSCNRRHANDHRLQPEHSGCRSVRRDSSSVQDKL